ncbi:MAG: hypothetical protein ACQETB_09815 [Halobacteriota archaeon]
MTRNVGGLGTTAARWMTANAKELAETIPRPGCTWSWSETDLDRSLLCSLKNKNLIVHVGEQEWRTPEKTIEEIANYGRLDLCDIGVDIQCEKPGCVTCAERRVREIRERRDERDYGEIPSTDEVEQSRLTGWVEG